jgi:membrane associated rhomboid family serine protease
MSTLQSRNAGRVGIATAVVVIGALLMGMWVLEAVDQVTGNSLDPYGIRPQTDEGLVGIFVAPWLHGGWAHLIGNSIPFLLLGILVLLDGWRRWAWATLVIVVASGLTVWLFSPPSSITLGASGVVFGWLTYLLVRGFYSGSFAQIGIGIVVFFVYGGILWGVLPTDAGISWQGHLGGAVGGVLAARWLHGRARAESPPYR